MKTVGVIGGMGPETSADFYLELIRGSHTKNKTQRPAILLWSVPIPLDVEEDLILKGTGEERYIPFLIDGAKRLEEGGADFIVIPCNTVHIFIDEIRNAVCIPVLSIVEETTRVLKASKIRRVGFLSTELTIRKGVYHRLFHENNIIPIAPSITQQNILNRIIQNILSGETSKEDIKSLEQIMISLSKQGAEVIVLACTDLQHILQMQTGVKKFDTMKILADITVKKINDGKI